MEPRLINIYDRVADWLKFAEAKNAGLVAFNIAVVAGIFSGWNLFGFLRCAQPLVLFLVIILLLVAAAIALAAMIPRLAFIGGKIAEDNQATSTIFFGHVANYEEPEDYLRAVAVAYDEAIQDKWKPAEIDLATQIIQNSKIAKRKYGHFKAAGWITLVVIGFGIVPVVIVFLRYLSRKKVATPVPTENEPTIQ